MARVFMEKGPDETPALPLSWKELVNAPVKAIAMAGYDARSGYDMEPFRWTGEMYEYYNKNIAETSKDMVKIQVLDPYSQNRCQRERVLEKFQNDFDDDNSLTKYQKTKIVRMMNSIMHNLLVSDGPVDESVADDDGIGDLKFCLGAFDMKQIYTNM
jgi:hypothetical protein